METRLTPVLRCKGAAAAFHGKTVLHPFDFEGFASDVVAVCGPSGAGKTTFLRLAAGLLAPAQGSVAHAPAGIRIGFAFQTPRLLPWRKAWQNVAIPLIDAGDAPRQAEQKARALLAEMQLEQAADLWPASLSGGMAQRVSLARALAVSPAILLLDEPLTALDEDAKQRTLQTIKSHAERCRSLVLYVTHNTWETQSYATRHLRCENGAIVESGRNENVPNYGIT